ncbi:MAG: electron transport complex subunit RsxE [Phycisphaerae bacterium]|nr:electron transport complex subunit RsxE [Phycisphaerae bacterium]
MSEPSLGKQFTNGLWAENPVLVMLIGMCPTLAITNSVANALTMGAATTFVLICSNVVISLLRKQLQPHLRMLVYMLIIATFVTIADYALQAYLFEMSQALGPYVPLIIVNCIILARAEICASKSGPVRSFVDGVGMGLGFTFALTILGVIRELLGMRTVLSYQVLPEAFVPWVIMILPSGAFLTLGLVIGLVTWLKTRKPADSRQNKDLEAAA